jgi:hypothetical protein
MIGMQRHKISRVAIELRNLEIWSLLLMGAQVLDYLINSTALPPQTDVC